MATVKMWLNGENFALVDEDDFVKLSKYTWYMNRQDGYVKSTKFLKRVNGLQKNKIYLMHRVVMNPVEGEFVDHINHVRNDNRKSNLRLCNKSDNGVNLGRLRKRNKSGYQGVIWLADRKKWRAMINVNMKQTFLGHYDDVLDAVKAYDDKAVELHGEFYTRQI